MFSRYSVDPVLARTHPIADVDIGDGERRAARR
jgi:hypothetical protein